MNHSFYMKFAIDLAEKARGQTSPNPAVGAVVVKNGEIIGFGAHLKAGEGHAEVLAMQMAGDKAVGSTVYVTLEPCSHYGKTPPCANLLIDKKVSKVVIASLDPNPLVSGNGVKRLKESGIEVIVGVEEDSAKKLNDVFFYNMQTKEPFVTVKTAISLDGKTATHTGESKWITGEEARYDVHTYRHWHDAILVGVNTVIADDPSLTTRLDSGGKNPIRIVLDTSLRIPTKSNVLTDKEAPTWIITSLMASQDKIKELNKNHLVEVIQLESNELKISAVLKLLGKRGITSLFVEGGATVNGSFLKEKKINQLITYIAPTLIGGGKAPTSFGGEGFQKMVETLSLSFEEVSMIGNDIKIIAKIR
ncbi:MULTISPECIES: bifunctional diaminohydroxyphosphoribosylaminopyrimidine deaminase/5-amino-6-(5-phosphoribosylamino)uracil reductase RibD [Bacillus]|uniref:bifunctional diaminohydroxyphosphoribosylaminopyrimidine deaminase/5-amino-6-(5-phosphoribosylamino)uracil reductase RibD n=1 Tax=Bacillus TaxID=1386 RepID=UPI000BB82968|nr:MULTISPECIES: bifunctional diaminohydroxyphosphoribosylaminopyrimidine deaminase/5-amino-6-(5-phosphoribosylamino)uracil reductase RibD [Bacillus]